MRQSAFALLTLLLLALAPAVSAADELVALPELASRVTDLTATLDATQQGRLEMQLATLERMHGGQAAVLLLPSTRPETIEQFGIRLAEAWKIGHQGADNGLIVIVAKDDRTMRIEVGYGLEGVIPDVVAKRIIEERMAPRFRQGDFFGGLRAAIESLDQVQGGGASQGRAAPKDAAKENLTDSDLYPWLMALLFGSGLLRRMFGLLGGVFGALVAGGLALAISGSWLLAILAAVAVLVFSVFQWVPLGSGGGLGGGFGGGGGGFGGGGGGFGGGGASGRW